MHLVPLANEGKEICGRGEQGRGVWGGRGEREEGRGEI